MKYPCECSLRECLSRRLARARKEAGTAPDGSDELFMLDARAYAELEQGQKSCCLLTFISYLCFCCKDVEGLVADLKRLVLEVYGRENHAS